MPARRCGPSCRSSPGADRHGSVRFRHGEDSKDAHYITVKLPKEEATAVVESDPKAEPCGCGLGRHGWVSVQLPLNASKARWEEVREWVRTSYTMVAPKTLAQQVLEADGLA